MLTLETYGLLCREQRTTLAELQRVCSETRNSPWADSVHLDHSVTEPFII